MIVNLAVYANSYHTTGLGLGLALVLDDLLVFMNCNYVTPYIRFTEYLYELCQLICQYAGGYRQISQ